MNELTAASALRWRIRKDRSAAANPARPWQLWLIVGEVMGLKAEHSRWEGCMQARARLIESSSGDPRRVTEILPTARNSG